MSKIDRADVVVGSGDYIVTAGAYKDEKGETRYRWGIRLDIPTDFPQEMTDRFIAIGKGRVITVKAASVFNKETGFGSQDDAEAFAKMFSHLEGWEEALAKAERVSAGPKVAGPEARAEMKVAEVLKVKNLAGKLADVKVAIPSLDSPPKDKAGRVNYRAWAKLLAEAQHPWYAKALKEAKEVEKGFD